MATHFTAGEAKFPASWEMMRKDSCGKKVHYHLVDLQPSDSEYKEVHTTFISTMTQKNGRGSRDIKTVKI